MEKIKKYDNILLWIGITIFSAIIIFQVPISIDDELWNFQNIYKMVNGYPIYEQANVIITPIFFWIGEILFRILGANYFIYRLFNAIIYATMILIIYNILKQLKIQKRSALLYTLILHYFIHLIVMGGANYNTLAMLFVMLGIYIALIYKNKNTNRFIWLNGIILYCILFTKQNIGVFYLIGSVILQLVQENKKKKAINHIAKQIGIAMILSIGTLVYFAFQGTLYDFINYAFLGMREFGTRNFVIVPMCIIYIIVAIITIMIGFFVHKKIADQEQKKNITILLSIGIPMLLMIYPIINLNHSMFAILPSAILLMYLADMMIKEFLNTKIINIIIWFMIIVFGCVSLKSFIIILKNNPFIMDYQNPYYGVFVPKETQQSIEVVNQYIQQQDNKVIIFSKEAALYNIPEKRSNGAMDLPFLGNLGYHGEDAMLEKIKQQKGYQVLLTKEKHWQESDKIINYIRNHYKKIGNIEKFEIYQIQ